MATTTIPTTTTGTTDNGLAVNIQLPLMIDRQRKAGGYERDRVTEREGKGESDRQQVSLSVNGARKRNG